MKIRTSIAVLAVAALVSWALPGARTQSTQVAHEFLMVSPPLAVQAAKVEPVQLAVLFQHVGR